MTRQELIRAASRLPLPTREAALEYEAKSEGMAAEITVRMREREDLDALIGPGNSAMMEDNHRNHARFLSSLLANYDAEVFVNTVLWVFRAYRAHGFRLTYWPALLDTWVVLLERNLSADSCTTVLPVYRFMLVHQPDFVSLSDAAVERDEE